MAPAGTRIPSLVSYREYQTPHLSTQIFPKSRYVIAPTIQRQSISKLTVARFRIFQPEPLMLRLPRLKRAARIIFGAGTAVAGGYALMIAAQLRPVRRLRFTTSSQNPREFAQSPSCALANPKRHTPFTESIFVTIDVPPGSSLEKLTDEQILARVLKGYFGGWAIAPEQWALWAADADIARFQEVPSPGPKIWYPSRFSNNLLPPLHSRPIGGFLVLDQHCEDAMPRLGAHSSMDWTTRSSFIDLGFGFNEPGNGFCGVDRYALTREFAVEGEREGGKRRVRQRLMLSYQAMACNPSEDRLPVSKPVLDFHSMYAKLLFKEGVARLMRSA